MKKEKQTLILEWGALKGWEGVESEEIFTLLRQYHEDGVSMLAGTQKDTPKQRELLLKMVDAFDAVYLYLDAKYISKTEAKEYITNYRLCH